MKPNILRVLGFVIFLGILKAELDRYPTLSVWQPCDGAVVPVHGAVVPVDPALPLTLLESDVLEWFKSQGCGKI